MGAAEGVLHQTRWDIGTGREALVHTIRRKPIRFRRNVRVHFIAGTQHLPSRFPAEITTGSRPTTGRLLVTMRALLAMHRGWGRDRAAESPYRGCRIEPWCRRVHVSAFPASRVCVADGGRARVETAGLGGEAGWAPCRRVPAVDERNERRHPAARSAVPSPPGLVEFPEAGGSAPAAGVLAGQRRPFAARAARDSRRSIEERYRRRRLPGEGRAGGDARPGPLPVVDDGTADLRSAGDHDLWVTGGNA
jgi:hypothetical protein